MIFLTMFCLKNIELVAFMNITNRNKILYISAEANTKTLDPIMEYCSIFITTNPAFKLKCTSYKLKIEQTYVILSFINFYSLFQ